MAAVNIKLLSRLREAPVPLERKDAAYWARGVEDEELMALLLFQQRSVQKLSEFFVALPGVLRDKYMSFIVSPRCLTLALIDLGCIGVK